VQLALLATVLNIPDLQGAHSLSVVALGFPNTSSPALHAVTGAQTRSDDAVPGATWYSAVPQVLCGWQMRLPWAAV